MKKLIYSPFALLILLLAASCQKDDSAAKPVALPHSQDSLATVTVVNNSNTPYEVSFQGTKQMLDVPKSGKQSMTIKAGTYNIEVYPAGSSTYTSHTISWGNLPSVLAPRANFNSVQIDASSSQSLLISQ